MAGGDAWTGGDILDSISTLSQALISHGAEDGARVALLAGNSIEVLLLQNAAEFTGAVFVALHPMGSLDDHLFAIEDAEVSVLIFDPAKFADRATALLGKTGRLKAVLSLGPTNVGTDLLDEASALKPSIVTPRHRGPNAMVRLSYSGGTTGKPKAIPLCQRSFDNALQIMLTDWEWPIDPRILTVVPLSHVGSSLFPPMVLKNGTMVVMPSFDPGAVLKAI
jgi:fatty-acyl-CoA synthase